jgi:hypothetical protein
LEVTNFLGVSDKYLLVYDIIRRSPACSVKLTGLPYDVNDLSPNDIEAFFDYLVQLNREKKGEVYTISEALGNLALKTLSTFNSLFLDKNVI